MCIQRLNKRRLTEFVVRHKPPLEQGVSSQKGMSHSGPSNPVEQVQVKLFPV